MGGNERGSARHNPLPERWPSDGTTDETRAGRSEVHSQRRPRRVSENRTMFRDMEESFYDAIRIFNYAERFQMPSIHLIDKGLANNSMTISPPKADLVPIQRGKLIQGDHQGNGNGEPYRRFAFTEDGVSPRAVLGMPGYRFWNTGDEHDEMGLIEEDPDNRVKMMTKRMTKLETSAKEIPEHEKFNFFRSSKKQADVTIVSWGSTKGPILDAMKLLEEDGIGGEF